MNFLHGEQLETMLKTLFELVCLKIKQKVPKNLLVTLKNIEKPKGGVITEKKYVHGILPTQTKKFKTGDCQFLCCFQANLAPLKNFVKSSFFFKFLNFKISKKLNFSQSLNFHKFR